MIMMLKKILVAEDNPSVLKMLKLRLEHEGYLVFTATDGEAAMQEAILQKPNLILLDVRMPKLDGYAVCRGVRQDPSLADTFIIVVTASESEAIHLADRCLEVGASDWISKPFQTRDLMVKIHRLLDEKEKDTDV